MPVCAANETRAVELIENLFEIDGPFKTESLSGGLSGSDVIKVSTSDNAYVVRFWNMHWAEYFPQDLACQLIASDAGYGPKVYFANKAEGITIMDYHFPENLPEISIRLPALVKLLKKMHEGPQVPMGVDRAVYLDSLFEDIKETPVVDLEFIRTIKDTVFACTRPNARCVPCHRDLHQGNLLYTQGNFYAIDYTWGAMDDPYADLANVAIVNCNTPGEERLLLELYLGHAPTPIELARLALMKVPAKMFYGLEFLIVSNVNASQVIELILSQVPSKSYMDFACHGSPTPSSADFLHYAISILGEVIDYSRSEQYVRDLEIVSSCCNVD